MMEGATGSENFRWIRLAQEINTGLLLGTYSWWRESEDNGLGSIFRGSKLLWYEAGAMGEGKV